MESAVATHPRQRHRRPRPSASSPALLLAAALLLQAAHAFHPAAAPPGKAARLQQQRQQKQQSPLFSRVIPLASYSAATEPPQPSQAAHAHATTATTDDTADAPFDWWRQWYPVALTRDLDPTSLTKATLLGRELVLWKEGGAGGQWRCFLDRCPHRLAPLSEGRVDGKTGHLQCAYHGWEFDATGACTKIPQVRALVVDSNGALGLGLFFFCQDG